MLIAGAGIGGLTAALSLHDSGFDQVEVVEVAPELRPLGAGVNLLPNAVRELAALGLYHQIVAVSVPTTEVCYHNDRGDMILRESRSRSGGYDWPQLSVHRGRLQMLLVEAVQTRLGRNCVRTGCRVTGFAEPSGSGVRVDITRDGRTTTVEADVLIGADGIRSTVRRALYEEAREPVWNGIVAWRGMTWSTPIGPGNCMIIAGDGTRKVVFYAISPPRNDGRVLLNWAASAQFNGLEIDRSDWNRRVPAEKVAALFAGWKVAGTLVTDLVYDTEACFEYPVEDCNPLPRWSRGPVTLLGDAAHAMQPMGSNGTTQAILDARAVAYFLAVSSDPIEALADYERHRRPLTTRVQLANRDMGPEAVIDIVAAGALGGFAPVDDDWPYRELREVATKYAELAAFDRASVNMRSPYDVRRARLVELPLTTAPAIA